MKKIISAVLCLVLLTMTLVSCAEDPIGDYLDEYDYVPPVIEELTLNLYIITDDATTSNAKETVRQRIAQYTQDKYHTTLNVKFVSAADYNTTVTAATAEGAADRADIVLVNSKAMFDQLYSANLLCDLTDLYATKDFGKLNVQIAADLLSSSLVHVTKTDENGYTTESDNYFAVPNNRVVGAYTYLLFSKSIVREYYAEDQVDSYESIAQLSASNIWLDMLLAGVDPSEQFAEHIVASADQAAFEENNYFVVLDSDYKEEADEETEGDESETPAPASEDDAGDTTENITYKKYLAISKATVASYGYGDEIKTALETDKSTAALEEFALAQKSNLWFRLLMDGKNPADYITEVQGMYEDKAAYEAEGNYCNIVSYPTSDADDVFKSAFAVINGTKDAKRAMELVYAINNDIELRNLLQYGIKDTNYTLEEVNVGTEEKPKYIYYVTRYDSGESVYYMDLLYTGNIFNAYYCEAIGWTHEASANGTVQNQQSNAN